MHEETNAEYQVTLKQIEEIYKSILSTGLSLDEQQEVGKLVNLIPRIGVVKKSKDTAKAEKEARARLDQIVMVRRALTALERPNPNIFLARTIRREIANSNRPWIPRNYNSAPPSVKVTLGLFTTLFVIAVGMGIYIGFVGRIKFLTFDPEILPVILFGAIGSSVSIFYRINVFRNTMDEGSSILFFTGCFKPFIGISFALFLHALHVNDLLPFLKWQHNTASYAALSFLAGFSERLATDIINNTSSSSKDHVGKCAKDETKDKNAIHSNDQNGTSKVTLHN